MAPFDGSNGMDIVLIGIYVNTGSRKLSPVLCTGAFSRLSFAAAGVGFIQTTSDGVKPEAGDRQGRSGRLEALATANSTGAWLWLSVTGYRDHGASRGPGNGSESL